AGPWLEELSCWQDREYALRILAASPRLRFVPAALSYYRLGHGPGIGDDWWRSAKDLRSIARGVRAAADAIEAAEAWTPLARERLAKQFVNVGRLLGELGEVEEGRAALRDAAGVARGSRYASTVNLLRGITAVAGFRATNRALALRKSARTRLRRTAPVRAAGS